MPHPAKKLTKLIFRPTDTSWPTVARIVHPNTESRNLNTFMELVGEARSDFPLLRLDEITVTVTIPDSPDENGAPMIEFELNNGIQAPGYKELRENFDFTGA